MIPYNYTSKVLTSNRKFYIKDDYNDSQINVPPSIEIVYTYTSGPPETYQLNWISKQGSHKGLSHYYLDYLWIAFTTEIIWELKNKKFINNENFRKFVDLTMDYGRILEEFRKNAGVAHVPIHLNLPNDTNYYDCFDPARLVMYKPKFDKTTSFIPDIKKFQDDNEIRIIISKLGVTEDQHYFVRCNTTSNFPYHLFFDILEPIFTSFEKFQSSKIEMEKSKMTESETDTNDDIINDIFAMTNEAIISSDNEDQFDKIEQILNSTIRYFDDLIHNTNIEINIMNNKLDLDQFEDIKFDPKNIDSALVIPQDTDDVVNYDEIAKKPTFTPGPSALNNVLNLSGKRSKLNITPFLKRVAQIREPKIISGPEILNLTMAKIYKNIAGEKTVKYLDENDLKILEKEIEQQQSNYLKQFEETKPVIDSSGNKGVGRIPTYELNYKAINFGGAGNSKIKYKFRNKKLQNFTSAQSGGRLIDIDKDFDSAKITESIIQKIDDIDKELDEKYKEQNEKVFNNEEFDLEKLQTKTRVLLDTMTNILNNNLNLNDLANEYKNLSDDEKKKINEFNASVNNTLNLIKKRLRENKMPDDISKKLLSNNQINESDVGDSLSPRDLTKLITDPLPLSGNKLINNNLTITLLRNLYNEYPGNSSFLINYAANNYIEEKPDLATNKEVLNDAYKDIYGFYVYLDSLNENIIKVNRDISDSSTDIKTVKENIGKVIDNTLNMNNEIITQMMDFIKDTSQRTKILDNVQHELRKSKIRINNFRSHVKELNKKINESPEIDPKIMVILNDTDNVKDLGEHPLSRDTSRDTIVNNYLQTIYDASNNLIKFNTSKKEYQYTESKTSVLRKNIFELDIIGSLIYDNWDQNVNSDPANLRNKIDEMENLTEKIIFSKNTCF